MSDARSIGRMVGVLFIAQGVIAPVVNFTLLGPALNASPGFLLTASAHASQVHAAALLMLVTGALWLGIAVTVLPLFRQYSDRASVGFVVLAVACFSGVAIEAIGVRSMLAVSQQYASSGALDAAPFQAAAAMARSLRHAAHYTNLLLSGASFLVFYGILFRFRLIPRALSIFGVATVLVLIAGALIPLLGYPLVMQLFMPIGLSQLALIAWLLLRGFEHRPIGYRAGQAEAEQI